MLALLALGAAQQRDSIPEAGSPRRLALAIGNNDYRSRPLQNAVNDAQMIGMALKEVGFEVETRLNLTINQMEQAAEQFVGRVRPGDVAVFYYSGHGMQIGEQNYLIPVDFDARTAIDAKYKSYAASRIQEHLETAGVGLQILVFDACRDNPFRGLRGSTGGLAAMEAGKGTYIAFATAPGRTADDNPTGRNGLFSGALVEALRVPGLTLDQVFNRVRTQVATARPDQVPWSSTNVLGEFYFRPPKGPPDADAWEAVRGSNNAQLIEQFLREYPSSSYAGAARLKLAATRLADGSPGPVPSAVSRGAARISLIDGSIAVKRGAAGEWASGVINAPLLASDHISTRANSRAEIEFDGANVLRIGGNAEMKLATLENGRFQVEVARGTVTYAVLRPSSASVELDTPSVSVRPAGQGTYRISVYDDGVSLITVRAGRVEIFTPRGSQSLSAGQTMAARATATDPECQILSAITLDDWDRWNEERGALASTIPPVGLAVGSKKVNQKDGLTYVWIPPGRFMMGCSPGDSECYDDERPAHEVEITRGFWLGESEVTQSAWERVMGKNIPSRFEGDARPVEVRYWDRAKQYCASVGGRLPSEAEWEYAARAGSTVARYGSLDKIAWYLNNSGTATHPVGRKQPNSFGLYDMLGNMWEWVADRYDERYYEHGAMRDPRGPASGDSRIMRGGSWNGNPRNLRVSNRRRVRPGDEYYVVGCRCALD